MAWPAVVADGDGDASTSHDSGNEVRLGFSAANESAPQPPIGIHLSMLSQPNPALVVMWTTHGATDPGTFIRYRQGDDLTESTGVARVAQGPDAYLHEAIMNGLVLGQPVRYQVGSPEGGWSTVIEAKGIPDPRDAGFRFVLIGDHGMSDAAQRTTAEIIDTDPDLVVIAGDVSYAEDEPEKWDIYFEQIEPLAARVPLMAAIGNHAYVPGTGTSDWQERFHYPDAELYYSFDVGRTHFLMLQSDTEAAAAEGILANQLAFAHLDLRDAAARRDAGLLDHLMVVQHHPLYSNSDRNERRVQADQAAQLEAMLVAFDVDLLLVGHNHNYERSYPMVTGAPTDRSRIVYDDPTGFIQVTSGGAGRSLYDLVHPDDTTPWSAAQAERHHMVVIDVHGETLVSQAVATDRRAGDVLDRFMLRRG